MKFNICSFQAEPNYLFHVSYKVNLALREIISEFLEPVPSNYELVFSISCYEVNPNQLILLGLTRGRKKPKANTQFISFPHQHIQNFEGYLFNLEKFDFEYSKKAYRGYPILTYASLIVDAIEKYFMQEGIQHNLVFSELKKLIKTEFETHPSDYAHQSEELMHLEDVIEGRERDPDWLGSEIGKKWSYLAKKYAFDLNGKLVLSKDCIL